MAVKRLLMLVGLVPLLTACAIFKFGDDGTANFKHASAVQALEAPEGLIAPGQLSQRFTIPGEGGAPVTRVQVGDAPELPDMRRLKLEQKGEQQWLSAAIEPKILWPHLSNFWKVRGIPVERDNASEGVMTALHTVKNSEGIELRHQYTLSIKPTSYQVQGHTKIGSKMFITAKSSQRVGNEWLGIPAQRQVASSMLIRLQSYLAGL